MGSCPCSLKRVSKSNNNTHEFEYRKRQNDKTYLKMLKVVDPKCSLLSCANCVQLERLQIVLTDYCHKEYDVENIEIDVVINDFLHLLKHHNTNTDFEDIYNKFGGFCDVKQCDIFKRIYRNRKNNNIQIKYNTAKHEIMDKIHCFYTHCFDIGYRLFLSERQKISEIKGEEEKLNMNDSMDKYLINQKTFELNKILSTKRRMNESNCLMSNRIKMKYSQLCSHDANENNKFYNFGFQFKYGYEGEKQWTYDSNWNIKQFLAVSAKYSSLKEELIGNDISIISIEQFKKEYVKATIHFNSDYCKQMYPPITNDEKPNLEWIMKVEYLLSLMIYCNHTEFQYEFSKTYRNNKGSKHNNFYHLGKYLKICSNNFGTHINRGNIRKFYHGIGERLLFEEYMDDKGWGRNSGIVINGPLSTSSSFEVATNFTNNNNGLIIEFGNCPYAYSPKYISVSWLSDFGNESELLFVQSFDREDAKFGVCNIYDVKLGYEYRFILEALKMMNKLTERRKDAISVPSDVQMLISKLLLYRLSESLPEYKSVNNNMINFSQYAKQILNVVWNNKKALVLDCSLRGIWKYRYRDLCTLYFHKQYKWIKIRELHVLYPNIEYIYVKNVNLCVFTMDDMLNHLRDCKQKSKLRKITVYPARKSKCDWSIYDTVSKYKEQFEKINLKISKVEGDGCNNPSYLFVSRM